MDQQLGRPAPLAASATDDFARPALPAATRRRRAAGAATALGGLVLLVYVVARTGIEQIAQAALGVGWAFILVLALSGFRYLARALAWMRCAGEPRLPLASAFQAILVGDALGNLTPLGLLVSEPAKAAFVRAVVPWPHALSALAVETFLYTLSAAAIVVVGLLLFPFAVRAGEVWWLTSAVAILLLAAAAGAGHLLLSGRIGRTGRLLGGLERAGLLPRALGRHRAALERFEVRLFDLYAASRANLVSLALLETLFHLAAVAETYLTLALVTGVRPTLVQAVLFESANRFLTAAFKFVPLRLGVDEAGTAIFAGALECRPATGVALALVRKVRVVCWTAVGLLLLARRGALSARGAPPPARQP